MADAFIVDGPGPVHFRNSNPIAIAVCGAEPPFRFSGQMGSTTCLRCLDWLEVNGYKGIRRDFVVNHRTIVCLCGSTLFRDAFLEAARDETLAGRIVLSVGSFGHADGRSITDEQKAALDELHLRKIDLAHEVLIINPGSYIGESTKREIAHAIRTGKPVRYLVPPAPPLDGDHPIIREVQNLLHRAMNESRTFAEAREVLRSALRLLPEGKP
jgi:hypothetical protein